MYRYLASPYTHADPFVREQRYLRALEVLKCLTLSGLTYYSPVVHFHPLAKLYGLAADHPEFYRHGLKMLDGSVGMDVLRLEGWHLSRGIKAEVTRAASQGKSITYISGDLDAASAVTIHPDQPESPAPRVR